MTRKFPLSIVIPFYKIDYFEETITSLKNQTDKRFNLYIGNDFSPNDPLPIINSSLDPSSYEYYYFNKNIGKQGISLQWKRIIDRGIKGEWVLLLGDDDVISSNFVEIFNKNIEHYVNVNVIKCKNVVIDGNGKILESYFENYSNGEYEIWDSLYKKFRGNSNSSLSEHIFRLSKLSIINFRHYPLAWHTDDMLLIEISDNGKFYFLQDNLVQIRRFEGSVTGSKDFGVQKKLATKLFLKDLSDLVILNQFSLRNRLQYYKVLKSFKNIVGFKFIKNLIVKNGSFGRIYLSYYLFKLMIKQIIPEKINKLIQKGN